MYLDYYQLSEKPFQITADSHFLWLGEKHKEALAAFKYGVLYDKSFLLLTGPVGTGKTTLTNALVASLSDQAISAKVVDPHLEVLDFFKFVASAFDIQDEINSKADFLASFTRFLEDSQASGKKVLLIIDEAQRIEESLLEEIRLLSNIEKEDLKLLTIFFVGHVEFLDKLESNYAIQQRITVNYDLLPLDEAETAEYIQHRLNIAGREEPLFDEGAVKQVHTYSEGTPRLINIICDHALLTGFLGKEEVISGDVIDKSVRDMRVPGQRNQQTIVTETDLESDQASPLFGKPSVGLDAGEGGQPATMQAVGASVDEYANQSGMVGQAISGGSVKTSMYVWFFSALLVILAISGFFLLKALLSA